MEVTQQQVSKDILDLIGRLKTVLLEVAENQGITRIQLSALYCVCNCGEVPMSKVAGLLNCDPSNVTGLVDRLVGQGMVTREECPNDRRAKRLRLTTKGKQLVDDVYKELPGKLGLDKLTQEEIRLLHSLLIKLSLPQPKPAGN